MKVKSTFHFATTLLALFATLIAGSAALTSARMQNPNDKPKRQPPVFTARPPQLEPAQALELKIDRIEPSMPIEGKATQVWFILRNLSDTPTSGKVVGQESFTSGQQQQSVAVQGLAPGATYQGALTTFAPPAGKNATFEIYYITSTNASGFRYPLGRTVVATKLANVAATFRISLSMVSVQRTRTKWSGPDNALISLAGCDSPANVQAQAKHLGTVHPGNGYPVNLSLQDFTVIPGDGNSICFTYLATHQDSKDPSLINQALEILKDKSKEFLKDRYDKNTSDLISAALNAVAGLFTQSCDGLLAQNRISVSTKELGSWGVQKVKTEEHPGYPSSYLSCGGTSHYQVTWKVLRTSWCDSNTGAAHFVCR
jgi:hypothetical protein